MIIRIFVAATHRDRDGCERRAGDAYLVDEAKARELAAIPSALAPRLEAANPADDDEEVAALAAELFPAPEPAPEPTPEAPATPDEATQ